MIVGILLAGGASKRMGTSKPLVRERGHSFIAHGIRHLWGGCDVVVTVLGSQAPKVRRAAEAEFQRMIGHGGLHHDLDAARARGARGLEVRFVLNRRWRSGMLASVQAGLREGLRMKPEALVVMPVDHPSVKPATVAGLVSVMRLALEATRGPRALKGFRYALVPRHARRRGHPIVLPPGLAQAVLADRGALDLSDAVKRNARLVGYLDVADRGVVTNRNTPRAPRTAARRGA